MATCLTCGNAFDAERSTKKYCSAACRQQAYLIRLDVKNDTNDDNTLVPDDVSHPDVLTITEAKVTVNDGKFHWVVPDLFKRLEEQLNQHEDREKLDALMVSVDRLNVKIVTSVWQSVLQRILRFSYRPHLTTRELRLILDAMHLMTDSFEFRHLTSRYPYKKRIQELSEKWKSALENRQGPAVFELDESLKLELFRMLCEIGSVSENKNIPFIYQTHK